jgi:hypothetical protein
MLYYGQPGDPAHPRRQVHMREVRRQKAVATSLCAACGGIGYALGRRGPLQAYAYEAGCVCLAPRPQDAEFQRRRTARRALSFRQA